MKQILMPCGIAILIGLSTSTWAGKDDHVLVQEAAKNVVMVNQIAQLADETGVTLTGQITKHLRIFRLGFHLFFERWNSRFNT